MRELSTIQKREKLNRVYALDNPGVGSASHEYQITPNGCDEQGNAYPSQDYG